MAGLGLKQVPQNGNESNGGTDMTPVNADTDKIGKTVGKTNERPRKGKGRGTDSRMLSWNVYRSEREEEMAGIMDKAFALSVAWPGQFAQMNGKPISPSAALQMKQVFLGVQTVLGGRKNMKRTLRSEREDFGRLACRHWSCVWTGRLHPM